VAERVVELLEVIDVEHQQRQRETTALRALDLEREAFVKVAVVVETGEAVGDGELREACVRLGELVRALVDLRLELAVHLEQRLVLRRQRGDELLVLVDEAVLPQQIFNREQECRLVPRLRDVVIEMRAIDRVDHGVEAGLTGEQDLRGRGEPAVHDLEELDALHARHDLIGDHERDRLTLTRQLVEQCDGLVTGACGRDLALVTEPCAELRAQHAEHAFLVVDADDDLTRAHDRPPNAAIGSRTSNTVLPGRDVHASSPPCLPTICRVIPRPSPVPSPFGFVV
jgi:hypothetical protein